MNRQVVFYCNKQKLAWRLVVDALLIIRTMKEYFQFDETANRTLDVVHDINGKGDDILSLIWKFDQSLCSDPRDRIFSLFGLAVDVEVAPSPENHVRGLAMIPGYVDYDAAVDAIYIQFAESCIQNYRSEAILLHIGAFGALHGCSERLPSWVPDWSKNRDFDYSSMWGSQKDTGGCRFVISHNKVTGYRTLQTNSRVIKVKGVLKCEESSLTWENFALKIWTFVQSSGFDMPSILQVLLLGMQKTCNTAEFRTGSSYFSTKDLTKFLFALLKCCNFTFRRPRDGVIDQLIRREPLDDSYQKSWMTESLLSSFVSFLNKFTVLIFNTSEFIGLGPQDTQAGDFVFRERFPQLDSWNYSNTAVAIRRAEQLVNRDHDGILTWDQRFKRVIQPTIKNTLQDHACRIVGPCLVVGSEKITGKTLYVDGGVRTEVGITCDLTII